MNPVGQANASAKMGGIWWPLRTRTMVMAGIGLASGIAILVTAAVIGAKGVTITGDVKTTDVFVAGSMMDLPCGWHQVQISNGSGEVLRVVKTKLTSQIDKRDGQVITRVCQTTYTADVTSADVYSVSVPGAEKQTGRWHATFNGGSGKIQAPELSWISGAY